MYYNQNDSKKVEEHETQMTQLNDHCEKIFLILYYKGKYEFELIHFTIIIQLINERIEM